MMQNSSNRILKIFQKKFSECNIVKVDYNLITNKSLNLQDFIEKAFGLGGNGALVISNIPNFGELRSKVLRNAFKLSQEPVETLKSLSKPHVKDPIGWYEEKFYSKDNEFNSNKFRSFFARYPRETIVYPQDPILEKESTNIWPTTIPKFKEDFVNINNLITSSIIGVMRQTDSFLNSKISSYNNNLIRDFENNYTNTNRMIIYEPLDKFNVSEVDKDHWDFWHTDYSIFTSITHPLYFSKEGECIEIPATAFWIKDRQGVMKETKFAQDELLIQMADSMFILSAGHIPTTPHCVKSQKDIPPNVYRVNLATFFEPQYNYIMRIPSGESFEEIIRKDPGKYFYRSLNSFEDGCNYKEFTNMSLATLLKN